MRKALLLSIVLILTLTACGDAAPSVATSDTTDVAKVALSVPSESMNTVTPNTSIIQPVIKPASSDNENAASKFKSDYESESKENRVSEINTDAVIYEIDWTQATELLNSKEKVFILFSASWCPYCQTLSGPLTNAIATSHIPLYYVNAETYPRTEYKAVNDNGQWKAELTSASKEYDDFLVAMEGRQSFCVLSDYILHPDDGVEVQVGTQRIMLPTLICIDGLGPITGFDIPDNLDLKSSLSDEDKAHLTDCLIQFLTKHD